MRAIVVASGVLNHSWLDQPIALQPGDLLIAADGGARHCLELVLIPQLVIGDMDSLDESHLSDLKAGGAKIIQYPTHKDFTDLELALQHAQALGVTEVLLLGALGARWDQTIANLLLPAALSRCSVPHSMRISLVDGPQELFFVRSGEQIEVRGHPGDTVSLISLAGDAYGVTTQNLEYPLHQDHLCFGSTRGISNVLLAERATIAVEEGLLLCVVIHS